jgi:hypothetical protein
MELVEWHSTKRLWNSQRVHGWKKQGKKSGRAAWRSLRQTPNSQNVVLQSSWKDNAIVLLLSTTHQTVELDPEIIRDSKRKYSTGVQLRKSMIVRRRKRPGTTSSSAKTARTPFHGKPLKNLPIPMVINDYNLIMGAADQTDELR